MNIKACPKCGSKNVSLYAAGHIGNYECLNCGYIGPLIIESEGKLRLNPNTTK